MTALEDRVVQLDFDRESVEAGLATRHIFTAFAKIGKVDHCSQISAVSYLVLLHDESMVGALMNQKYQVVCRVKGKVLSATVTQPDADLITEFLESFQEETMAGPPNESGTASVLTGLSSRNSLSATDLTSTSEFPDFNSERGELNDNYASADTDDNNRGFESESELSLKQQRNSIDTSCSSYAVDRMESDGLEQREMRRRESRASPKMLDMARCKQYIRLYVTNRKEIKLTTDGLAMLFENFEANTDSDDVHPDDARVVFEQDNILCIDLLATPNKVEKILNGELRARGKSIVRVQLDNPLTTPKATKEHTEMSHLKWDERTVQISGFAEELNDEAKELLELKLESLKIGGGRLHHVDYTFDRRKSVIALATFRSKDTAKRLLGKTGGKVHFLNGALAASAYTPPPPKPPRPQDKRTFILSGLSSSVSNDVITTYFYNQLSNDNDDDVEVVHRSADDHLAVIRFQLPKEIERLQKQLARRTLSRTCKVELRPTFESDTIQVFNLKYGDHASLEAFCAFLDNSEKSGVHAQFDAKWSESAPCLVVTFDDYRDAGRALQSVSKTTRLKVVAFYYLDYLGHAIPADAILSPTAYQNLPKGTTVCELESTVSISDEWTQYFATYAKARDHFIESVRTKCNLICKWKSVPQGEADSTADTTLLLVVSLPFTTCMVEREADNYVSLAEWKVQSERSVKETMQASYSAHRTTILKEVWAGMLDELKDAGLTRELLRSEQVKLIMDSETTAIIVRGAAQAVSEIASSLEAVASKVHEQLKRKKERVRERLTLKHFERKFLQLDEEFLNELKSGKNDAERTGPVELTFGPVSDDIEDVQLELSGAPNDVLRAKLQLAQYLKKLTETAHSLDIDEDSAALLGKSKGAWRTVKSALEGQQLKPTSSPATTPPGRNQKQSKASMLGPGVTGTARGFKILKESLIVDRRTLDQTQAALLDTDKWQQFVEDLTNRYGQEVRISYAAGDLVVVTFKPLDAQVLKEIDSFFSENSILNRFHQVNSSVLRFLQLFSKAELERIKQACSSGSLQFSVVTQTENSGYQLAGTKNELQKAVRQLAELIDTVSTDWMPIENPIVAKWLLYNPSAHLMLEKTEQYRKCAIDVLRGDVNGDVDPGEKARLTPDQSAELDEQRVVNCVTLHGVNLTVVCGDALKENGDVIATFTDRDLKESSGGEFRRELFKLAGELVEKECDAQTKVTKIPYGEVFFTASGNLRNFRHIAHVICVLSVFSKSNPSHEHGLIINSAVVQLLNEMNQRGLSTLVLPVIFNGRDVEVVVESIVNYLTASNNTISEVRLVGRSEASVTNIAEFLERCATKSDGSVTSSNSDATTKPKMARKNTISGRNGLQVKVVIGELLQQNAQVLVDVCTQDLNLADGEISSQFLLAAGSRLQTECTLALAKAGSLQFGGFIETSQCSLCNCRAIFHTALPTIDSNNPQSHAEIEQSIRTVCKNMLDACSAKGYTSIALPALGTGSLKYPAATVARAMLDVAVNYTSSGHVGVIPQIALLRKRSHSISGYSASKLAGGSTQKPTSDSKLPPQLLRNISIVCSDKDVQTCEAFLQELERLSPGSVPRRAGQGIVASTSRAPSPRTRRLVSPQESFTSGPFPPHLDMGGAKRAKVGGCVVEVLKGDIVEQYDIESTVNSTDAQFSTGGKVMQSLLRVGGEALQKEIASIGSISGAVACTSGGNTHFRYIFHAVAPNDPRGWSHVVKQCLKTAEEKQVKSIALPALGTGSHGQQHAKIASSILDAVAQFATDDNPIFLKRVRLCIFQEYMVKQFEDELEKKVVESSKSGKTLWQRLWAIFRGSQERLAGTKDENGEAVTEKEDCQVSLLISFVDERTPELVSEDLQRFVAGEQSERELRDDLVGDMEGPIMAICKRNGVVGITNRLLRKVTLQGLAVDVERTYSSIMELLNDLHRRKSMHKEHALLYKSTRWEFEHAPNDYTPYSPDVNFTIEEAYKNVKETVELALIDEIDGTVADVVISFADMMETDLQTKKQHRVKRSDLTMAKSVTDVEMPKTWTVMTPQDGRVKEHVLLPSDQEYVTVSKMFLQSAGSPRTILEIRRIQNPELYNKYMVHKRSMEARLRQRQPNMKIERRLYHGTSEDSIVSINKYGFNRSYCGKNAVVYGNGVYFAVNSSYSSQDIYSRPSSSKEKFVYYARVLVGESTVGHHGLIVPPLNQQTNEQYDSVTDNSQNIIVIFSDTQAYPEYLIKFQ